MIRFLKIILFIGFLTVFQVSVSAQNTMPNIENLTDQQLVAILNQYQLVGLSDFELDMKAKERGLSQSQITALKKRIAQLDPASLKDLNAPKKAANDISTEVRTNPEIRNYNRRIDTSKGLKPFGASIFNNEDLSFEPNLNIATPQNYVIGVNDQLLIDIFGNSDITQKIKVNPEGDIRVQKLGPVRVAGLTIEDARIKLKNALTKIYPGIANGSVSVQLSIAQIRSIRVTIIGEIKRPGNYDISSLSTLMNGLFASGGPNEIGSFRDIELVRNGKKMVVFDLYDFLLKSDLSKNLLLQDGDVIRVNPYAKRVTLNGAVKKPALFDVKENETAADILAYAGGFADIGYKEMLRVYRFGAKNKEILSVKKEQLSQFKLMSGDNLEVDTIANSYVNRVGIFGSVYYPGFYGISVMPTLKDLLIAAKPHEDAYLQRALLRRLKVDYTPEIINFNINEVLNGSFNISLIREDSVQIFRVSDLREKYTVSINGEVNKPGIFDFSDSMTAQDLVLMASGYKDGASLQKIEISRRLRQNSATQKDSSLYSIIKVIDATTTNIADLNFKLSPFDIISVRRSPIYKEQISVKIEGEVLYPGKYTLTGNTERISDLVKRAGGLKQKGFAEGAVLIRNTYRDISENDAAVLNNKTNLMNTQNGKASTTANTTTNNATNNTNTTTAITTPIISSTDTSIIANLNKEQKPVGIKLDQILKKPGSAEDLFLVEGDVLKVPNELQTIQTFGAVNVPKQIVYVEGISFKDALKESGRFSLNAARKNSYVIYPNGQVRKTRNFLFFRSYPSIKPGTEIYVPIKKQGSKLSTGELIGIISSVSGMISMLVVLLRI